MGRTTYAYAAILEFDNASGLLEYLRHPSHAELGRKFWDVCADTIVLEVDWRDAADWLAEELV